MADPQHPCPYCSKPIDTRIEVWCPHCFGMLGKGWSERPVESFPRWNPDEEYDR